MNMTSTAATMTQVVSIAGMASLRVGSMTHMVEKDAGFVMRPAYRICPAGLVRRAKLRLGRDLLPDHAERDVGVLGLTRVELVVDDRLCVGVGCRAAGRADPADIPVDGGRDERSVVDEHVPDPDL